MKILIPGKEQNGLNNLSGIMQAHSNEVDAEQTEKRGPAL
jgi:hypothetical protein